MNFLVIVLIPLAVYYFRLDHVIPDLFTYSHCLMTSYNVIKYFDESSDIVHADYAVCLKRGFYALQQLRHVGSRCVLRSCVTLLSVRVL